MAPSDALGQFGIIGTGRVARALAYSLNAGGSGVPLLWGRSHRRTEEAAQSTGCTAVDTLATLIEAYDVIAIAVSDDAIAKIVEAIANSGMRLRGKLVFHLSGGSGTGTLRPLLGLEAEIAAIHPAMTFTGEPRQECARMVGACFAVKDNSAETAKRLR